jgi:hypothetical protein
MLRGAPEVINVRRSRHHLTFGEWTQAESIGPLLRLLYAYYYLLGRRRPTLDGASALVLMLLPKRLAATAQFA